ncbi:unnamed protein product [Arctia plantaginis]|uniref:Uncharacterized protein n=1 Tax=Arctia plantaginis TaxID=874455 RepID=A0A8S0Z1W5_ARCPL|nr:unnamed protein product [Arctia plantaginis]
MQVDIHIEVSSEMTFFRRHPELISCADTNCPTEPGMLAPVGGLHLEGQVHGSLTSYRGRKNSEMTFFRRHPELISCADTNCPTEPDMLAPVGGLHLDGQVHGSLTSCRGRISILHLN